MVYCWSVHIKRLVKPDFCTSAYPTHCAICVNHPFHRRPTLNGILSKAIIQPAFPDTSCHGKCEQRRTGCFFIGVLSVQHLVPHTTCPLIPCDCIHMIFE